MQAVHFSSASAFRDWLEQNHATATELVVGLYTKASGRGGLTYPDALDEALCFGWIDGIRRKSDEDTYTIRFTPRRPGSVWSNVNVRHVARLAAAGRMHAAGHRAFAARDAAKTGIYSFENRPQKFPAPLERQFRGNRSAWKFWRQLPPGYQRMAIWWVISAKQDETRQRRLARLVALSLAGRRLS